MSAPKRKPADMSAPLETLALSVALLLGAAFLAGVAVLLGAHLSGFL